LTACYSPDKIDLKKKLKKYKVLIEVRSLNNDLLQLVSSELTNILDELF